MLNLYLGHNFDGEDLRFSDLRGTYMEKHVVGYFSLLWGLTLLNAGRHLHEVKEVMGMERFALIVWATCWGGSYEGCVSLLLVDEEGGREKEVNIRS